MSKRHITLTQRYRILTRDHYMCRYCGRRPPEVELRIDHVIPYSKGGKTVDENLVTACFECNAGKSDKIYPSAQGVLNQAPAAVSELQDVWEIKPTWKFRPHPRAAELIEKVKHAHWHAVKFDSRRKPYRLEESLLGELDYEEWREETEREQGLHE